MVSSCNCLSCLVLPWSLVFLLWSLETGRQRFLSCPRLHLFFPSSSTHLHVEIRLLQDRETRHDKTRKDKTRHNKARQDKARFVRIRVGIWRVVRNVRVGVWGFSLSLPLSIQGDKTRQDKTRHNKARQDKARFVRIRVGIWRVVRNVPVGVWFFFLFLSLSIQGDKTRQDKTRHNKARQDKARFVRIRVGIWRVVRNVLWGFGFFFYPFLSLSLSLSIHENLLQIRLIFTKSFLSIIDKWKNLDKTNELKNGN